MNNSEDLIKRFNQRNIIFTCDDSTSEFVEEEDIEEIATSWNMDQRNIIGI
jgi:hypothetical protein